MSQPFSKSNAPSLFRSQAAMKRALQPEVVYEARVANERKVCALLTVVEGATVVDGARVRLSLACTFASHTYEAELVDPGERALLQAAL